MSFNYCRVCLGIDGKLLKIGRAAHVHPHCYLDSGGRLADLPRRTVWEMPCIVLKTRGLWDEAMRILERRA